MITYNDLLQEGDDKREFVRKVIREHQTTPDYTTAKIAVAMNTDADGLGHEESSLKIGSASILTQIRWIANP